MTTEHAEWYASFNSKKRNFEMFTKGGNNKCQSITRAAIRKVFGQKRVNQEQLEGLIGDKISKASKNDRFSEIWDSEPPRNIAYYVNKALKVAGYGFEVDHYNFH